jgi:sulfur transfer complex TusBCD TusB component (DsrH family)
MRKVYSPVWLSVGLMIVMCAFGKVGFAQPTHLVISQVYGGGGNSGATYTNDFIEIFNPTGSAISLSGLSVQYNGATATGAYSVTALTGTIGAGKYYLIQEASGGAIGSPLPSPNATGTINLAAGAGKVALATTTTPFSGTTCLALTSSVIDFVGYGSTANCSEVSPAPGTSNNTTSILRRNEGCMETDNNSADFTNGALATGAASPRNSSTDAHICPPPPLLPLKGEVLINQFSPAYDGTDDEYVELVNTTNKTFDLSTLRLNYKTPGGNNSSTPLTSSLSGTLQPYSFWLIASTATVQVGLSDIPSDGLLTPGMGSMSGQIALILVSDTGFIVDGVGYGTVTGGNYTEGTSATNPTAGSPGLKRVTDGLDNNNNSTDFDRVLKGSIYLRNSTSRLANNGASIVGGNYTSISVTGASSLANNVTITDVLDIDGGTLNTNNKSLTLKSTVSNTARVGVVTNGGVTGNVTVERFIGIPNAKRAWRLLTAPLRSTTGGDVSIFDTWQLGGAIAAGRGTIVTGPNANQATNGLDAESGFSLKSFDGTNLVGVQNTKTTPLFTPAPSAANKAYFIFVRGDRSSLALNNNSQTTLSATGALQTGDQTFATTSNPTGFVLVPNPYASPVDFDLFRKDNLATATTSNINPRFYFYDPNIGTVGGYVTVSYSGSGSAYNIAPANSPTGTPYRKDIQNGQAIFLETKSTGTPSVTFKETQKGADTSNAAVFRTGSQYEKLAINLNLQNTDGTWLLADGVLAVYNNNYSSNIASEDARKMMNIEENLGIVRNGRTLSIEGRPLIDNNDTVFLSLVNVKSNSTYQFELSPNSFDAPGLTATLEDAYLKTRTPVSLSNVTTVNFNITEDTASAGANRFRVVFKESSTLPINFTTVKAYQKENNIAVEWNIATETNIVKYEVEKSPNGQLFTKAADINARGNNGAASYTWLDVNSVTGNNYYRIKAIENSGNVKYSEIVNVKIGKARGIVVYPNPVTNKTITIQLNDQQKGTYTIRLFNTSGQTVYSNRIVYMGGAATQTLKLNSNIAKGNYTIEVTGAEATVSQRLVID